MILKKNARVNLYNGIFLSFTLACTINISFANESSVKNLLLGKWTMKLEKNCRRPTYEFTPTQIIKKIDADGELVEFRYLNPEYVIEQDIVKVDFKKLHGIGGAENDHLLLFKFVGTNSSEIILKKGESIELLKCPVKKFRKEKK